MIASFTDFCQSLLWPLCRILAGMACGLFLANILEALGWNEALAKISRPLASLGHMGRAASSSFALAFISPQAANGLLSENRDQGKISAKELVLANLFNGLPSTAMHLPSIFFLLWPVLGAPAIIYVELSLLAAAIRTCVTMLLGRLLLPCPAPGIQEVTASLKAETWNARFRGAFRKAIKRFRKRLPKLVYFTAPTYALVWFAQKSGFFSVAEMWLANHLAWLSFLEPQSMSIVALQILAETGATLGAVGAFLEDGALDGNQIVLALLVGNLLGTPLRALRHQLPSYAGFFKPALALKLVCVNQTGRFASMAVVIWIYLKWL